MDTAIIAEGIEIYKADAFDIMAEMRDGAVDHVISDVPYAERTHLGAMSSGGGEIHAQVDFPAWTEEEFLDFCFLSERVAKRWAIFTCDLTHAALAQNHALISHVRTGAWVKRNPTPQFTGDRPGQGFEAVCILHREGKKRWNGGGRPALWETKTVRKADVPSQKPLTLIMQWLADFTEPGELILDPCMGSGTTGVACWQMGRRFIGIEREPKHYLSAMNRLEAAVRQGNLFAHPPKLPRLEQAPLYFAPEKETAS